MDDEITQAYKTFETTYGTYDSKVKKYTGLLGKFLSPQPKYDVIVSEL